MGLGGCADSDSRKNGFPFYNFLYGLVFSFFIPLYCLYVEKKENGQ